MEQKIEDLNCANCNNRLIAGSNFCHNCGQRCLEERDLSAFLKHFLSDYFTFDSKILKSVKPLVLRPGFLTNEYLRGKVVSYIPPLRLFLFTSIIFFVLLGFLNNAAADSSFTTVAKDQFWDRFFSSWLPKLFFVLLPLFALILGILFRKSSKGYLTHFLFSFHFHATIFLSGIFYVLASWILAKLQLQSWNVLLMVISAIFVLIYLWIALKKVYRESILKISYKYLILAILYSFLISASTVLLALFLG